MIHITELEKAMMIKIARSEYTCLNGGEPNYPNETSTWVDCVICSNEDNAVLFSLIQKGIVCQYQDGKDSVCCLSDEGFKIYKSMEIIMPKKLITINFGDRDYEYELVKIDSTHFKWKNLTLAGNYVVYHIGEHYGSSYYDEINNWLHSQN